jgi:hypothetical protein
MPLALTSWFPRARRRFDESAAAAPPIKETDLDRILKMIPTEVLALYTAALPVSPQVPWRAFPFALFLVGLVLVPIVLYLDGQNTGQPARWTQYVVRTLAFAAWAIAVSWPFSQWSSGDSLSWLRSLAVLIVPLVGGLVLRADRPESPV